MKIIKNIGLWTVILGWIFVTNYHFLPIQLPGALLTYKTGLLSLPEEEDIIFEDLEKRELSIAIDSVGIPYIYGEHHTDAAFGLGYMHAKDRYFQMELMSRMVLGELSEIFGEDALESDIFWKPYGFMKKSEEILDEYRTNASEVGAYLDSYAEGVNYYLEHNTINDPLYLIFDIKPRPWKSEYSLLATWYMSWNLSYFDYDLQQQELNDKLVADTRSFFFPKHPENLKTILPSSPIKNLDTSNLRNQGQISYASQKHKFNKDVGSNNWAINASKTMRNIPLLANDPHLFLTLPNAFYESLLISNEIKVYGYSIPGTPVIVSGHNDTISWGITNGEWDITDRYSLKVKNDSLYWHNGAWKPFYVESFAIAVKDGEPFMFDQKSTVHGNVIQEGESEYYAQKWYASEKSYSVKALFNVMKSQNWSSFKTALETYDYPPQNFIYSDSYDTIGMVCAGKLPFRKKGYFGGLLDGTEALPKSNEKDSLWYTQNPNQHFLFSSNQQPVQNETYFGAHWFKDDYRTNRMHAILAGKGNWDIPSIIEMQMDEVDISFFDFEEMRNRYDSKSHRNMLVLLDNWDGDMSVDTNQAMLYEVLRRSTEIEAMNFSKEYLKVEEPVSFKYFTKYLNEDQFTLENALPKQELFDNIMKRTDSILMTDYGSEWREMTYAETSGITIYSLSFLPGFGTTVYDVGGNKNTINMNADAHPAFRTIFEMGKDNISGYSILAGGQSGKINSKHYLDQIELWRTGAYRQTQYTKSIEKLKNVNLKIKF